MSHVIMRFAATNCHATHMNQEVLRLIKKPDTTEAQFVVSKNLRPSH